MAGVIADTSVWIQHFRGTRIPALIQALEEVTIVMPPLVVAELLSGAESTEERSVIGELLQDAPLHPTPLAHWIAVGDLRRMLRTKGVEVTVPDAHVAQCALDLDGTLLSTDTIFRRIARHCPLRLAE